MLHPPSTNVATEQSWVTRDVRFILLTQLVFGFGWSLYLLTPKFLATALHAGPETIGRIGAMGGATGLLTVPFTGLVIDRVGRRVLFQCGAALLVLLSVGFTQVDHIGPLVYLLQGCISAAFVLAFNASASLLADHAPPQRLGQAIGWVGGVNVAMNAVSTMLAEPLAVARGWHAVFVVGIAAGMAALLLAMGMRESAVRPSHGAASPESAAPRSRKNLIAILISATLMGAVFVAVFGFIQPYAVSLGAAQVRGFFLGFTLAAVAGRVFFGGLGDRLGRRPVSVCMLVGYALAAYTVRELSPDRLILYGLLFGAAHGIAYPTLNALVLEVLPPIRRGLGMVLYNGAFNLGSSVGSLGWGMLASHRGYPTVYAAASCTALSAAALLAWGGGKSNARAA